MAKVKSYSFDSNATTKNLPVFELGASDLSLISETADTCVEVSTSSPIDRPEKWTFGCKSIENVYKNTGISASVKPASVSGVQIMVRHDQTMQVTDDALSTYTRQIPLCSWICAQVPVNDDVTEDDILLEIKRMLSGALPDGDAVTAARVKQLIRSALRVQ